MTKLTKCIVCGKKISTNVSLCPHCKQSQYRAKCVFCGKFYDEKNKNERALHDSCRTSWTNSVLDTTFRCSVCNKKFTYRAAKNYLGPRTFVGGKIEYARYFTCPECGEKVMMYSCDYCFEVLHPDNCRSLIIGRVKTAQTYLFHKKCYHKGARYYEDSLCFIVTASCGKNSLEVQLLRIFRDNYLVSNKGGRVFIDLYEWVSPPLSRIIAQNRCLRILTKYFFVTPLYKMAKQFMRFYGKPFTEG